MPGVPNAATGRARHQLADRALCRPGTQRSRRFRSGRCRRRSKARA